MAHATTSSYAEFSPEEAIHRIQQERTRKSILAAVVGALAAVAVVAVAYFSYRGIPAPASPANARPVLVEPYH